MEKSLLFSVPAYCIGVFDDDQKVHPCTWKYWGIANRYGQCCTESHLYMLQRHRYELSEFIELNEGSFETSDQRGQQREIKASKAAEAANRHQFQ